MTWRKALLWAFAALLGVLLLPVIVVGAAATAGFVYHRLTYEPPKVTMSWVEVPAAGGKAAGAAPQRGAAGESNPVERGTIGTSTQQQTEAPDRHLLQLN